MKPNSQAAPGRVCERCGKCGFAAKVQNPARTTARTFTALWLS